MSDCNNKECTKVEKHIKENKANIIIFACAVVFFMCAFLIQNEIIKIITFLFLRSNIFLDTVPLRASRVSFHLLSLFLGRLLLHPFL